MSTRAIVTVHGQGDTKRIYCHGDGYPSGVGELVANFLKVLPSLGQFGSRKVHRAAWGDWSAKPMREGRYDKFSPRGKAYSGMHNVAAEPDQFIPALTTYMHSKGYGSIYLTDRDPVKEAKEDWTDIEWHYVVHLNADGKPRLEVFEHVYDDLKGGSSKGHFVKKSVSMAELVEREQAEWRRHREEYEKKQKAEKRKAKRSARSGLRGIGR